jgi:excisionase family DNA binding protein
MKRRRSDKNILRISELAKRTGVFPSTIRHWVNEGLIPAIKTGKTMSYYDISTIERIKFIKRMQREKFLPLSVIKRLIDSDTPLDEELGLGETIFKTGTLAPGAQPVHEAMIEEYTSYSKDKIDLLERLGLIIPENGDSGKYYDEIDCKIIELIRIREEAGLPVDYSIESVKLYFDAIRDAVDGDMRRFVRSFLGDISTKKAIALMTEADELLDSLIILYRQKIQRHIARMVVRELGDLPEKLALLSVLPVEGDELGEIPGDPLLRVFYSFFKGDYDTVIELIDGASFGSTNLSPASLSIIALLLKGDMKSALRISEEHFQEPNGYMMDNTSAALANVFSLRSSSGFSRPIYLAKRAIEYLERNEVLRESNSLIKLFARYVSGVIFTMLPDIFDVFTKGIGKLEEVISSLENHRVQMVRLPLWLVKTVNNEIFPAIEVRVNRFLAEGYMRSGDAAGAKRCLKRIILLNGVKEITEWARLKRVEIES